MMRVVILCGQGLSAKMLYHGLSNHVNAVAIIQEDKPAVKSILMRRVKKLGLLKVMGQVAFIMANKGVLYLSRPYIDQLIKHYELCTKNFPEHLVIRVNSINNSKTIALLKKFMPDAVIVYGTRLISSEVLSGIDVPFLNTHMGITPQYRGVHGGYWALTRGDISHCGVTVHLVDTGIDTGGILYQAPITVTERDNFNTYPIHQIAAAIPLMKKALYDVGQQQLIPEYRDVPSWLWSHPTLFEYINYWLKGGVK